MRSFNAPHLVRGVAFCVSNYTINNMRILAIETSCDETGLAIVDTHTDGNTTTATVVSEALLSQALKHAEYGGVYPSLAKREHTKNLGPLLKQCLESANLLVPADAPSVTKENLTAIKEVLAREESLFAYLILFFAQYAKPNIDAIAVTNGPGLAPALWVGVNFAKALSLAWGIPIIPTNHLEGHVATALAREETNSTYTIVPPALPALILLISGGHTELILMQEWLTYKKIGSTRDDAVGEAFDKSARLLGLPYPGGPEVSKLAEEARSENLPQPFTLPRPMQHDSSFDFSFSGLKTAVRNLVHQIGEPTDMQKKQLARELEDAITDTLVRQVKRATEEYGAQSLIVGGGVAANTEIVRTLSAFAHSAHLSLHVAPARLATDNGLMIALAASLHPQNTTYDTASIEARGTLPLYRWAL